MMKTLGLIGAGNMGSALLRGLIRFGAIAPENVRVAGHHPEKLRALQEELGFRVLESVKDVIENSDAILFAVKPYHIEALLSEHREALKDRIFLSVISGYDFDRYEKLLVPGTAHLYIMPNTPAGVGAGTFLFEEKHSLPQAEFEQIAGMFQKIGEVVSLPSRLMGVGSAVAGCGPAFVAMAMEALADAAVKYGIPRALSYRLVGQMMLGTAKMQMETGIHPGELKDGVCSPAGTTICGVQALEKAGMRAAFMDAVDAVMNKKG